MCHARVAFVSRPVERILFQSTTRDEPQSHSREIRSVLTTLTDKKAFEVCFVVALMHCMRMCPKLYVLRRKYRAPA